MEVCEFVFVHRSPNRPVCDTQLYNPHIYIAYLKVIKDLLPFFNCFPSVQSSSPLRRKIGQRATPRRLRRRRLFRRDTRFTPAHPWLAPTSPPIIIIITVIVIVCITEIIFPSASLSISLLLYSLTNTTLHSYWAPHSKGIIFVLNKAARVKAKR